MSVHFTVQLFVNLKTSYQKVGKCICFKKGLCHPDVILSDTSLAFQSDFERIPTGKCWTELTQGPPLVFLHQNCRSKFLRTLYAPEIIVLLAFTCYEN